MTEERKPESIDNPPSGPPIGGPSGTGPVPAAEKPDHGHDRPKEKDDQ